MSDEGTGRFGAQGDSARRRAAAAVLSALIPGAGQLYAGRRRRGAILLAISAALIAAGVLWLAVDPIAVAKLAFEPDVLRGLLGVDLAVLAFRGWAAWDAYRCIEAPPQSSSTWGTVVAGLATAALLVVPHAWFAYYDLTQLDLITTVFAAPTPTTTTTVSPPNMSQTSAPPTTGAGGQTTYPMTAPSTAATTQAPTIWGGVERLNILLLGSDAGVGRTGVRTDTIILVSIDPATGDTALFGVPRNLAQVPLPETLDIWSCDCFPPIINELFGYAERNPEAFAGPSPPGPTALKMAIGGLLGIPIHYYALVHLDGFVDMIDALGGVTITVMDRVYDPAYPKEDGGTEVVDFRPGVYDFDGHDALAYARVRRSSDDYNRMGRQRCVLEALADQADPLTLLRGFPAVADAIKRSVETDIPLDSVPDFFELAAKVDTDRALALSVAPPTYIAGLTAEGYNIPDVELIHEHVRIATTLPPQEAIDLLGLEPLAEACGR